MKYDERTMKMTMERLDGNGDNGEAADVGGPGEHVVGELAGTPLDPERLSQAVDLSGPMAVRGYEPPMDPHAAFVAAQYGGMDHMGGG
jgi:hypothetical protein